MTDNQPHWHKSSYSGSQGASCVEVATEPSAVHVRDSKHPDGPRIAVRDTAWGPFLALAQAR